MTTTLTVINSTWITPVVKRIHFRSDDLSAFGASEHSDRYVKLVFPKPGVVYPEPLDIRAMRRTMAPEQMPDVRTYTALFPNVEAGTLAIDFVIHGDDGVAGPWAAQAKPGDTLHVNGPGGAFRPAPEADWYLLVGDESALPAIVATLGVLAPDATGHIFLMVDSLDHEPELHSPPGVNVHFVYRGGEPDDRLALAVQALDWPAGRVHAFIHGEAQEIMHTLRPWLKNEKGLTPDQLSISGYWRRGRTEDGFRLWKSELSHAEGR